MSRQFDAMVDVALEIERELRRPAPGSAHDLDDGVKAAYRCLRPRRHDG